MKIYAFVTIVAVTIAWSSTDGKENEIMEKDSTFRYLALGDSYTIGTSIARTDAFPYQLMDSIRVKTGLSDTEVKIIARNAWRTDDLQRAIKRTDLDTSYDIVSLLIGVNNQYQGLPLTDFAKDFNALLDTCEKYGISKSRIFVLSIPNYGYTPYGLEKREAITRELALFNAVIQRSCNDRDISVYNVTDISLKTLERPDFVAKDQLHPSSSQYSAWISSFIDEVVKKLED